MKFFGPFLFAFSAAQSGESVQKQTAETIRERAFDIISHQVKYDENIALSPLSIVGAMYMLAAGSAGESRAQILNALNFNYVLDNENDLNAIEAPFEAYHELISRLQKQPEEGYTLDIANGMFHQINMSMYSSAEVGPKYVDILQKQFIRDVANIVPVDYQTANVEATDTINKWIAEQTKNKIPQLFKEPLGSDTLVVLASSLYFKASWNEKFRLIKKGSSEDQTLCWANSKDDLLNNICNKNIQWMKKEEDLSSIEIKHGYKLLAKVIDIPMKNKQIKDKKEEHKFTMQIWLPEEYITSEAEDIEFQAIIKANIGSVRKTMQKGKVAVVMPKFEIEYKDDIIPALQALGISDVFNDNANLEPMLGSGHNAYVNSVNHGVSLTVDEKGVEGAAVTSIQISSRTFHQPTLFHINKPFYFVISNRCWQPESNGSPCDFGNIPLFIGRYVGA